LLCTLGPHFDGSDREMLNQDGQDGDVPVLKPASAILTNLHFESVHLVTPKTSSALELFLNPEKSIVNMIAPAARLHRPEIGLEGLIQHFLAQLHMPTLNGVEDKGSSLIQLL